MDDPMARQGISLFLPSLRGGGAERSTLILAGGLVQAGARVEVVLAARTGPLLAEVPPGVEVVDLGASRVAASLGPLIRYLQRRSPAFLISALDHANLIALLAGRMARGPTRLIVTVRNPMTPDTHEARHRRQRAVPLLARVLYPGSDAVVAISQAVADDLAGAIALPRSKIVVIHNGIDTHEVRRKAQAPLELPFDLPPHVPFLVGCGRLTRQKGFELLLHAVSRMAATQDCIVCLLGEGEERASLEGLARDLGLEKRIYLPGFKINPWPVLARADVVAVPSRWEGLGRVVLESLALGKPIVACQAPGGHMQVLGFGRYGRIVPGRDADRFSEALLLALREPPPPEILMKRAEEYSVPAMTEAYLSLLRSLPEKGRRGGDG
jgi:glycosyltransferase involved in cell wall biosynthesis